ncbi:GNAT family N-acetyltransferase [Spirosoma flavus]
MATYTMLLQEKPQSTDIPEFCESGFFFNELSHLQQQQDGQFHLLTALNQTTQQADARCAFFIRSNEAVSPGAAPFGSIEFTEKLPDSILDEFLDTLTESVRATATTTFRLVNYPHCYAPGQARRLTRKLFRHGFRVVETNQNFFLPINNQDFASLVEPEQRRRLNKCRNADFQFSQWKNPPFTTVVDFLKETRQQQGYRLTLSPERLTELLQNFPDQFLVFAVTDGPNLAALTVAVRVRHDILYNFMPASHPDYRTFSPMVMLTDGLYTYCQQQGIRLLDLGVSLDSNHCPKPSLMRFKRNLGAVTSPKLIFEKVL